MSLVGLGVAVGPDRTARAQPVSPPRGRIDADLWADPQLGGLSVKLGFGIIQVGKTKEVFSWERAVLRVPAGMDEKRVSALLNQNLALTDKLVAPTLRAPTGKAPPSTRRRTLVLAPRKPVVLPKERYIYVKLGRLNTASVDTTAVDKAFGPASKFDSTTALSAMQRILEENERLTGSGLSVSPDFVAFPAGIATEDSFGEDKKVLSAAGDTYWSSQAHDLWRAWQFAQVAEPATTKDIWVALVDQGFGKNPGGIVWDQALPNANALDVPNDDVRVPWHGSMAGSALSATVADHFGAAGSALLGSAADIDMLVERHVRTIAVQMPQHTSGSWKALADGVDRAVTAGANIISVSYAANCASACTSTHAAAPLESAINRANTAGVIVLFAAGNFNADLDNAANNYVGCETAGALCVGGLDRDLLRWWNNLGASNYGSATALFGPADNVWLNPYPGYSDPQKAFGTSLATPFVAGMLALVQSSWGETFNLSQLQGYLKQPGVLSPTQDNTIKDRMLNAYALMRLRGKIKRDGREPNNAVGTGNTWLPLADDGELLSLHDAADHDFLPIVTGCEHLHARIDYLHDGPGKLQVSLLTDIAVGPARTSEAGDVLSLDADVCSGRHHLVVFAPTGLTTGYSVRLTHTPLACPQQCVTPPKADDPKKPADDGYDSTVDQSSSKSGGKAAAE